MKGIGMTHKEYWYWLVNIQNICLKKIKAILDYYGSPEDAFRASESSLKQIKNLKDKDIENISRTKNIDKVKKDYTNLINKNIYFVTV